ncbi:hypothetical protein COCON_G00099070 [Conger conger]|uniref:Uncharacterized protein n=1 Tax=Conger conger TaxID=82655 RepID=A0A9Q1DMG8_CONCO|nr:hypothetical protein COCON_G00099070 [Conger conger]
MIKTAGFFRYTLWRRVSSGGRGAGIVAQRSRFLFSVAVPHPTGIKPATSACAAQMSNSVDSPGELSFVSEHDTLSDSSDTSARRQRQRKEKEKKKKKKTRKKSERGVASHAPCETAADPTLPSSPCERKTPKVAERPATGQTNGAFEPDTD